MIRSELIARLSSRLPHFSEQDVELAVKVILEEISQSLASGQRIEIRGFGSFSLSERAPFTGRNPSTGEPVSVATKYRPHFKSGKQLQDQVNHGFLNEIPIHK